MNTIYLLWIDMGGCSVQGKRILPRDKIAKNSNIVNEYSSPTMKELWKALALIPEDRYKTERGIVQNGDDP